MRAALLVLMLLFALADASAREKTIRSLPDEAPDVSVSGVDQQGAREKAAIAYREFLKSAPARSALRAEALRRLADLELETAEMQLLDDTPETGAADALARAISGYRQLLAEFPDGEDNDLVLYQLARAEEQAGEMEAAQATLHMLVGRFASTRYAGEAWFRIGESRFLNREYAQAETAYSSVLAMNADSRFYDTALYKRGWSQFKLERYSDGLGSFFTLLQRRFGDDDEIDLSAFKPTEREVLKDTLRAVSLSFSNLDGAAGIDDFLAARTAPGWSWLLYVGLGELYLEQERYQDAALAYAAFVTRDPTNVRAPTLQTRVIDAYSQGGFPNKVLAAKEVFANRYHTSTAFWSDRDPAQHPEVLLQLKQHVTELARHYHAESQANGAPTAAEKAVHWYRQLLSAFPDDPDASNANFLLAELLFESGDFASASTEYARTAYAYLPHPKAAEAGYASLLATRRQLETLGDGTPESGEWQRKSIDDSLRFGATFPDHAQADSVLTAAAESLFESGDGARALQTATALVSRVEPTEPALARTAWTIIAHVNFDRLAYNEAEAAYGRAIALTAPADTGRIDLAERLAAAIYKQGEAAREAGNSAAAASHFLRVAAIPIETTTHPLAAFDAAAAFADSGEWARSASLLEAFRTEYPGHPLSAEVPRRVAGAWLASGDELRAARALELVASEDADPGVRRDALWQAVALYDDNADSDRIRVYERLIVEFPEPHDDAMEARNKLVDIYRARNDPGNETYWLNALVQADSSAGDARSDRSRALAAGALLQLARPSRDAYAAVALVAPLADSVRLKKTRLVQLVEVHTRAADYGVTQATTEATYHIAEAYRGFGTALMESERPPLDAEALEEYEFLLEEQAFPFEEKSIEIHTVNANRAAENQFDDWIAGSFERLAELLPVRYGKNEESETYVETYN